MNPFFTSSSAAINVSIGSGNRYFGSGCISNFIQFVFKASLANSAAKMASFAVLTPDVFGNKLICGAFKWIKISSHSSFTSTLFRATVISSLSEANRAPFINSDELNLPVPVNNRELNVLSPIFN